jgi:hypothetical protein
MPVLLYTGTGGLGIYHVAPRPGGLLYSAEFPGSVKKVHEMAPSNACTQGLPGDERYEATPTVSAAIFTIS